MGRWWQVFTRCEVPWQYAVSTPAGAHLRLVCLPRLSRKASLAAATLLRLPVAGKVFDFTQFLRDSISPALGSAEDRIPFLALPGLIDRQRPSPQQRPVEPVDRALGRGGVIPVRDGPGQPTFAGAAREVLARPAHR
jgi:hypothetical protein